MSENRLVDPIKLKRSASVGDDQWAAVCDAVDRLNRAMNLDDLPAIVGGSKELCESVAKVVLVARTQADEGLTYPALINTAHASLGRRPGHGDVAEGPIRDMIQGTKTVVTKLGDMRNQVGTGHGRATPPPTTREHASMAVNAARMWCEWALERLAVVLENNVDVLISELSGANFYSGYLAHRLSDIGLDRLSEPDAERLGRAIAQRGGQGGTFVVKRDGVEAAIRDPAGFPPAYRLGLVRGLFFDHDGYVTTTPNRVSEAAQLFQSLRDPQAVIALSEDVARADLAYGFDVASVPEIVEAIEAEAVRFAMDSPIRAGWLHLADRFRDGEDDPFDLLGS